MLPSGISMDLEIRVGEGCPQKSRRACQIFKSKKSWKREKGGEEDERQWCLQKLAKVLGNGLWQSPIHPNYLWSHFLRLTGSSLVWTFWHPLMPACQAPHSGEMPTGLRGAPFPGLLETALINSTFVLLQFSSDILWNIGLYVGFPKHYKNKPFAKTERSRSKRRTMSSALLHAKWFFKNMHWVTYLFF